MVDNLIDWKLELTLQERLTKREATASFVDDAGLTIALALLPWIVLIQIMFLERTIAMVKLVGQKLAEVS